LSEIGAQMKKPAFLQAFETIARQTVGSLGRKKAPRKGGVSILGRLAGVAQQAPGSWLAR